MPITSPCDTHEPDRTKMADKKETETLNPVTGWMVTEFIPATEPAKVTLPDVGAKTSAR